MEMDKRIVQMVDEGAANRIKELEAELGSMKSSHVTGATIHPSLCDEYTKACADNSRLRACLEDCMYQFAYDCRGPALITGGLSTLEEAFDVLGWESPHAIPDQRCDEPKCNQRATCGTPTNSGYRRTCGEHVPEELKEGE